MLLNNLYTLLSFERSDAHDKITSQILLNREHPVFAGHFPGNPLLPGVCTVQIIRELLEKGMKKDLLLRQAGNIKYLGFISPLRTPEIVFEIICKHTETGSISCSATVSAGGKALCSFKGEFAEESSSRILQ